MPKTYPDRTGTTVTVGRCCTGVIVAETHTQHPTVYVRSTAPCVEHQRMRPAGVMVHARPNTVSELPATSTRELVEVVYR